MKAYAIKDPNEYIYPDTVRDNEDESINCFLDLHGSMFLGYNHYYSQGYRCVAVEITEIKTGEER